MHNRTNLALQMSDSLWCEGKALRRRLDEPKRQSTSLRAYGPPANEPSANYRTQS